MKYNKIIVVGCPGAGKSTFSRKLAEKTGIPLYHLDALYWKEDWTHISRERLRFIQKRIMKNDSWIIDGNFMNTMETRIKRCNLIIFLDYQTEVCLDGIVQRVGHKRDDMPCIAEKVDEELVEFVKNFNNDRKPLMKALFNKYNNVKLITLKSREDADRYLDEFKKENDNA